MIHRTSYMEPPTGIVVQKLPVSNKKNKEEAYKLNKERNIPCFLYHRHVLYHRDSVKDCFDIAGVSNNGSSFQKLKTKGYHIFKDKAFIFIDIERLPSDFKELVKEQYERGSYA